MDRNDLVVVDVPSQLLCPHCEKPLAEVISDSIKSIGQPSWLHDADGIPGATSAAAGFPDESGSLAFLAIGKCPECKHSYAEIDLTISTADFDTMLSIQEGEHPFNDVPVQFYRVEAQEIPWVVGVSRVCGFVLHQHLIGPLRITGDQLKFVISPAGVSSCGDAINGNASPWQWGRDLVLERWNEIRALLHGWGGEGGCEIDRIALAGASLEARDALVTIDCPVTE